MKLALASLFTLLGVVVAILITAGSALLALVYVAGCSSDELRGCGTFGGSLYVVQIVPALLGAATLVSVVSGPPVKGQVSYGFRRRVAATAVLLGIWALLMAIIYL